MVQTALRAIGGLIERGERGSMAEQEPSGSEPAPPEIAALNELLIQYQRLWSRRQAVVAAETRRVLGEELQVLQERLFPLLYRPLLQLAFRAKDKPEEQMLYAGGEPSDVVQSLVVGYYLIVLEALPELRIDPTKSLVGLLAQVIRRRGIDQYRRRYGRKMSPADAPNLRDDPSWNWARDTRDVPFDEALEEQLADERAPDAEELIRRLHNTACSEAAWAFWQARCSAPELALLRLRLADPPSSYRAIIEQFGQHWTEAAARQRCHRLLKDAQDHLRMLGLLEDL
jgi:hypothetical protein